MSKFLFRRGSLIGKFLAADGCIIHEAAFSNGKNGHALLILACGGCVLLAAARARGRTPGAGARRGACGNDDGALISAEAEVAGREFIECALILKENDLAVRLPARLKSDAQLSHRSVADVLALSIDVPFAVSCANEARNRFAHQIFLITLLPINVRVTREQILLTARARSYREIYLALLVVFGSDR